MASKDEIKATILKVAGDPVSGDIADLADAFAEAIANLDNPKTEKRVIVPEEVR